MLDIRPIVVIEGGFLLVIGAMMTLSGLVDWTASSPDWQVFSASAGIAVFAGVTMILSSWGCEMTLNVRQGFLLTTTSWLLIAAFSALPFLFFSSQISYADAFFESISGLTTTGSTVLVGLDQMPLGILLWRSLLQWIGGIGIIVTAVAMLPFLRVGGMQFFRMESSDKSDKILPRAKQIAVAIALVYLGLTVMCTLAYWFAGMTGFEAVNHAMTTVSTGGFSTSDQSMGHFGNHAIHWIGTAFMLLGGLPFVLYVRMLHGKWNAPFMDSQVRMFLYFLSLTILTLTAWLVFTKSMPPLDALRQVAFNVVSIVTTTGYVLSDYSLWGAFPVVVFFFLTFVGGCTGSSAGGIKIFRFEVMYRILRQQLRSLFFPHGIFTVRYNERPLSDGIMMSVGVFVFQFIAIIILMTLLLVMMGLDFTTSLSGSATAMANVGPGLGDIIGPAGNFSSLPDGAKWVLSFGMLIGRLEIVTVLVLLSPSFWRS